MKVILLLIILLYTPNKLELKALKLDKPKEIKDTDIKYKKEYNTVIQYIKEQEGFRPFVYDDYGFDCVGYGQRLIYYKGVIEEPLTEQEASKILEISFNNHLNVVKKVFPKLSKRKLLVLGHISYKRGIGTIIKNKLVVNNQLDTIKLMTLPHKGNRIWEIKMFYN